MDASDKARMQDILQSSCPKLFKDGKVKMQKGGLSVPD
jgi:hypothetical protein